MKRGFVFLIAALLFLTACASGGPTAGGNGVSVPNDVGNVNDVGAASDVGAADDVGAANDVVTANDADAGKDTYTQISQEEAREMMQRDDGHVVVDVRTLEEYEEGHIPGAILIPNEDIETTQPALLPDLDQIILIYCRSGNRSKQASEKLFKMGYTNIYEFGGIITWTGKIVTAESAGETIWSAAEQPVSVRYDRLWIYSDFSEITDPARIREIVDAVRALEVKGPTEVCVEDYTDILTFTFADGTETRLEFEDQIWVAGTNERYEVDGMSRLRDLLDNVLAG